MQQLIRGSPGSRGKVEGTARVIVDFDQLGTFRKDDVLVTRVTSPMWTPVIHSAAAVVTEVGGALSHAAIVCREYGIPAVVGTGNATKVIKDGQRIAVDGEKGEVMILDSNSK